MFEDELFEKIDFAILPIKKGDYENCTFLNCDFSNADLSGFNFSDSTFKNCNLSLAKLSKTALREVYFIGCKLLGLHFDNCDKLLFAVRFEDCSLNMSSFFRLNLKKTTFKNTTLQEVDFTETDLSAAIFDNCDLSMATFDNTILEKADLRTAFNYIISPEKNRIRKAKFSLAGIRGILDGFDIVVEG